MAQTYGARGDLGCGCGLAGRSSSGRALVSRSAKPHPSPHLPPAEEERPWAASALCRELGEPARLGEGSPDPLWGSGQPWPPPGPGIPRGHRLRPIQPPSPSLTPQPQVRAAPLGLSPGPRTPNSFGNPPFGSHRFPRAVQDPRQPSCPRCSPPTTCSTPRAVSQPPDPATCWWPCSSPTSFIRTTIPFPSPPRWPGPLLPSGRPWLLRTGPFPCWKAQGSCSGAGNKLLPSHKPQEAAGPFLSWPRAQRRKELGLGASCPSGRKRGLGPSPGAVPGAGPLAHSPAPSLSLHWAGNPKGAAEGGHGAGFGVQAQPAWGWALQPFTC